MKFPQGAEEMIWSDFGFQNIASTNVWKWIGEQGQFGSEETSWESIAI